MPDFRLSRGVLARACLAVTASMLALVAPAAAQSHGDKSGTIIPGVAPIYLYNSAGTGQYALAVATATSLTPPSGATLAQICVETANIRYRDDGIAPTATVGIPAYAATCFPYTGPLGAIQIIAQSGSPTIDVSYYKSN